MVSCFSTSFFGCFRMGTKANHPPTTCLLASQAGGRRTAYRQARASRLAGLELQRTSGATDGVFEIHPVEDSDGFSGHC